VSKHLAVLKQAGLVRDRHHGRQTHYSAQLGALAPLIEWTNQMTSFLAGPVRRPRRLAGQDGSMSETSTATRTVIVEREIAHPPEKIWRALTQPHLISEWLMKNDFSPVVGHRFNLRGEWGGVLDCEVLVVEPQTTLSYTWNFKHDDPAFDLNSVVTFSLSPTTTGTRSAHGTGWIPAGSEAGIWWCQGRLAGVLAKLDQVLTGTD
jgi:uncharacterized protein YndB with AHSA1/START domain